jgi:hypothetical protein
MRVRAPPQIMVELVQTSSFDVRHAIVGCCSTGRNILFAGVSRRLCTPTTPHALELSVLWWPHTGAYFSLLPSPEP